MALLLFFLSSLALAISGLAGYAIFGPLSYRHMQDRRHTVGESSFDPVFLRWLLAGRYRFHADPMLGKLAAPARWLMLICLCGVAGVAIWLAIQVLA